MQTDPQTTNTPAQVPPAQITGQYSAMPQPLYQTIAQILMARANCLQSGNSEWYGRHEDTLRQIARDCLPSGAGVDNGSGFDFDRSTADRIVIETSYHHMDGESGMYAGWTAHTVTVRPSLAFGLDITIAGRDRNGIKDYLHDRFYTALTEVR